jgi:hypothetical protein
MWSFLLAIRYGQKHEDAYAIKKAADGMSQTFYKQWKQKAGCGPSCVEKWRRRRRRRRSKTENTWATIKRTTLSKLRMHKKEALLSNISFWQMSNPLILHSSHCNVHAFRLPPDDLHSYYDNDAHTYFMSTDYQFSCLPNAYIKCISQNFKTSPTD